MSCSEFGGRQHSLLVEKVEEDNIDECFRLLGLKRGAEFASVKQAYRELLKKCHPDRFQKRPQLLPQAERKTERLIRIYSTLEGWYERHGGVDPTSTSNEEEKRRHPVEPPITPKEPEEAASQRTSPPRSPSQGPTPSSRGSSYDERRESTTHSGYGKIAYGKIVAVLVIAVLSLLVWNAISQQRQNAAAAEAQRQTDARRRESLSDKQAVLDRTIKESVAIKEAWERAYVEAQHSAVASAEKALKDAESQYKTGVDKAAAEIAKAEKTQNDLNEKAKQDLANARADFLRKVQEEIDEPAKKYASFVRSKGRDAIALINKLANRDRWNFSAYADTDNPSKILQFWTPEEADWPENRVAAKAGIVLRANGYVFPHFRTNIYLYDAESKLLVRMMESVIEQNDAAFEQQQTRKAQSESEITLWDQNHPFMPAALPDDVKLVLDQRDAAVRRLETVRSQLKAARDSLTQENVDVAFTQSDKGVSFAQRIAAAKSEVTSAQLAVDQAVQSPGAAAVAQPVQ
jgi:hypothetical protein